MFVLKIRHRVFVSILFVRSGAKIPTGYLPGFHARDDSRREQWTALWIREILGVPQILQAFPATRRRSVFKGSIGEVQTIGRFQT